MCATYNYYQYVNGHEPSFIFGTNTMGQDLFTAVAVGARFSLLFAILVSVINLTIGAFYGAIQGYYGGMVDMIMDRVVDILSGVPFIVVTTLFQLHLAKRVGVVGSFIFAFVLIGWIGMAALTRKQFYRFMSQEFVTAARTLGASDFRLMFRHIVPQCHRYHHYQLCIDYPQCYPSGDHLVPTWASWICPPSPAPPSAPC